jgi:hypothetical protein
MSDSPINSVRIGALRPYPKQKPADEEIQLELLKLWKNQHKFVIISGSPGVGKTRAAEDFIVSMLLEHNVAQSKKECQLSNLFPDYKTKFYDSVEIANKITSLGVKFVWDFIVLHPQYTYEDLIRGYRISSSDNSPFSLQVREGVLGFISRVVEILEQTSQNVRSPLGVIILDEINRAPIGQLFGEALYAVDRRNEVVSTPYDLGSVGSTFKIPEGLLLLGTMNSVDRAISGFDFALRRRFAVLTMYSKEQPIKEKLSSSQSW